MAILPLQLARVSNLLRTNVTTATLTKTQQSLLEIQNQLSTGKKLNAPSDNPGDAAIAQQVRKLLEQREAYADNLTRAGSHLGEVDSTLGELSTLVQQAQTIASANVGSDVTPDARASAATIIDSVFSQILSVGNRSLDGVYLFAGDRSTDAPFVEKNGGVSFVGDSNVLKNTFDENALRPFMVDGENVFCALSTRVEGRADISPALSAATRLSDLRGATGDAIRKGVIQIGDGTTTANIDLTKADTVGDVINAINAAGVGGITAAIGGSGLGISLTGAPADNITVNEVGGGSIASDLGILQKIGAGGGTPVDGASVQASVTNLTLLANLRGGAGIDTTGGLTITNGTTSKTIDLTGANTVEDLLNAINGSGANVRAEINSAGTGINIFNPTQANAMTIAENGGTAASDLGVRTFDPTSPLAELNNGKGVHNVAGADFQLTDSAGVSFDVDIDGATTIQGVLDAINTAAGAAGAGVTAAFAATGNGIELTDTAAGAGTLTLTPQNFSRAASDLGLSNPATAGVIRGTDINAVEADGVFSHLSALRNALRGNDQTAITEAATRLQGDYDRVVRVRGETGARVQEIEARQDRLGDQNVATQSLLSSLEDVDFTEAIAKFQSLQTALQASLQSAAKSMNLSLMDFLG